MLENERNVIWIIYRSPMNDIGKLEQFAQDCMRAYKHKTGVQPTLLGVTSSFPNLAAEQIAKFGVQIIHNLPAWAKDEMWVGGPAQLEN